MDMDTVVLHGSRDQSLYKSHIRNSVKVHQLPSIYRPHENAFPSNLHTMGLLQAPQPFVFHSYPSYSVQKPRQPPLLPLPAACLRRSYSIGGPSCPPVITRTRDYSLSSKKPNSPAKSAKRGEKKTPKMKELIKNVPEVFPDSSADNKINTNSLGSIKEAENQVDMLQGFRVFSPPPSSLPLPSFSLRPKLSCNAEVAGVDAGATDNLRRLLRLQ